MDNRQPENLNTENQRNDIDLVSFDRRKRAEEIIRSEEAEREKRRREQIRRRKIERMRQAKIARIKGFTILGIMGLGALCIIIGIIAAIVKIASSSGDKDKNSTSSNIVSSAETELMNEFASFGGKIYTGKNNTFLSGADKMLNAVAIDGTNAGIPAVSKQISDFGALSERYMYMRNTDNYTAFRNAVKNAPIHKNGYVWSETDSMKSSITGSYLYDTNASYILAVANICISEGSVSFLSETDTDTVSAKDVSMNLTVSKKLEMAINYLFDGNTLDGGIKYDTLETGLCYIHTTDNNGSSTGKPSNKWTNFKFGYLDAYSNITFNKAMQALVDLYTLQNLTDAANMYKAVADANSAAFSNTFWNPETQRFAGCIDKDGNVYDYGFVFINLEAINAGMATKEQTSAILSWLDGAREIATDTSKASDIYAFKVAPRNNTLAADDRLWDSLGGTVITAGNGAFGSYYQNGGVSLSTAYDDIYARYLAGNKSACASRLNDLISEYNATGFATDANSAHMRISGDPLSGLAPTAVLRTVFGVDIDGLYLKINPDLSVIPGNKISIKALDGLGLRGINFHGNTYNVLYTADAVYVTSSINMAVRLKLGGFKAGEEYSLVKVKNKTESVDKNSLVADKDGVVTVITDFGSDSYIKIVKKR